MKPLSLMFRSFISSSSSSSSTFSPCSFLSTLSSTSESTSTSTTTTMNNVTNTTHPSSTRNSFSENILTAPISVKVNDPNLPKQIQQVFYPFFVHRVQLSKQLPVYVNKKCQHKVTLIRRIEGDVEALSKILMKELPVGTSLKIKKNTQHIEIKWDHSQQVRQILTNLGF